MTHQLPLFDEQDTIQVTVWTEGERYRAVISDGWWMATGKTEKEAVEKVVEMYEKERTQTNAVHPFTIP